MSRSVTMDYESLRARQDRHQHEQWQIRESATGGTYCAACGGQVEEPIDPDDAERLDDFERNDHG